MYRRCKCTMKSFLDGVSWSIYEELEMAKHVQYEDDDVKLTDMKEEHWAATAIPLQHPRLAGFHDEYAYILVDIGRWESVKKSVRVRLPCTVRDVLKGIRDVYQASMTEAEVLECVDDHLGYRKSALERLSRGEVVKAFELNGDRNFFEGLKKAYGIKDSIFEVCLGS